MCKPMDADEKWVGESRVFGADDGHPLVQDRQQEAVGQHVINQCTQFLGFEFLNCVDDGIVGA